MKASLRSQAFLFVCLVCPACVPSMASGASNPPQAAAPVFSLAGGLYNTPQNLVLTDSTPGAVIYYNTNGKTPNTSSAIYSGPIVIASTETVTAIAIAPGYASSVESAKAYRY